MASFTEYVKLITEAGQTLAQIAKVNEAITKLRENAAKPILIKINTEQQNIVASEGKIRQERQKTSDAESKALKQRLADYKAIKAMNAEQGGNPGLVKYGSQKSLEQGRQFNTQLEETTARINKLADAHKHIKQVSQSAGVTVTPKLADTLALQTVNKYDTVKKQEEAERLKAIKDRTATETSLRNQRIKEKRADEALVEQGAKRSLEIEKEKQRVVKEQHAARKQYDAEVEEGHRRVIAMEREQNKIAAVNQRGVGGYLGELARDTRRNIIYGAIQHVENMSATGFHAELSRSSETEALYQSGRTKSETDQIVQNAVEMSNKYPVLSQTEGMTLQRHAIGEVGTVQGGEELAKLAAPFVSLRTAAVGAEQALTENQKVMKGFNDLGWASNSTLMAKAYDQLAKMSQVEGKNYDVGSFLTTDRMFKSAKYEMSPDAILKIAPLLSIGEGAGRAGNEFAMLFKSLTYSGKSISKEAHAVIDGTSLSDGKGGYNPQLAKDLASGTVEGIKDFNSILDSAARKDGVNPDDAVSFTQWSKKAFSNSSANELAIWMHDQIGMIEKQLGSYDKAKGTSAAEGIENRDINVALQGAAAKFEDLSASVLEPFKRTGIVLINKARELEQWTSKNQVTSALGLATLGAGAFELVKYITENPGQAANTSALIANTGAVTLNTGSRALGGAAGVGAGSLGVLGTAIAIGGVLATIQDVQLGVADYQLYQKKNALKAAATDYNANQKYNADTITNDMNDIKDLQKELNDVTIGQIAGDQAEVGKRLRAAIEKMKSDKGNKVPFMPNVFNPNLAEQIADNQFYHMRGRGSPGGPVKFHEGIYDEKKPVLRDKHGHIIKEKDGPVDGRTAQQIWEQHQKKMRAKSIPEVRDSASSVVQYPSNEDAGTRHNYVLPQKAELRDLQPQKSELRNISSLDSFIKTLETAGHSAGETLSNAGSRIGAAGGSIVSAIEHIASEIAAINISAPGALKASASSGKIMHGPH